MKNIDIRLKETELYKLKQLVGTKLVAFYHDPFVFTNTSSQAVKIQTDTENLYLYSFTEPYDYYGTEEDVAVWSVEDTEYPLISKKSFIDMPVNETVKKIIIVNENQRVYEDNEMLYDVWLTRGIIFDFGNHQVSFEKAVWFSEDIVVRKGYELIKEFSPVSRFIDNNWEEGLVAECERTEVVL
ncbi:MAG: hypothetical protein K5750_08890 [Eubacterium sp.]|nr:hypothetical protein [Eubacterium sp.]